MPRNPNLQAVAEVIAGNAMALARALHEQGLLAQETPEEPDAERSPRALLRGLWLVRRDKPQAAPVPDAAAVPAEDGRTAAPAPDAAGLLPTRPYPPVVPLPADPPRGPLAPRYRRLVSTSTTAERIAHERTTALEAEAEEWDRACRRAQLLAEQMRHFHGDRPEVHTIRREGDRVDLFLVPDAALVMWRPWVLAVAGTAESVRPTDREGFACLLGHCRPRGAAEPVRVRLVGPGRPEDVARLAAQCREEASTAREPGGPIAHPAGQPVHERLAELDAATGHNPDTPRRPMPDDFRQGLQTAAAQAEPDPDAAPGAGPESTRAVPTPAEIAESLRALPHVADAAVVDGTVHVELTPVTVREWQGWLEILGIPAESVAVRGSAVAGEGRYRGVPVSAFGHGLPPQSADTMQLRVTDTGVSA